MQYRVPVLLRAGATLSFGALCLLGGNVFAQTSKENVPTAETIWQAIKDKPSSQLMDGFEIIEDFPLIPAGKGMNRRAVVLSAVLCYELRAYDILDKDMMASKFLVAEAIHKEKVAGRLLVSEDEASRKAANDFMSKHLALARRKIEEAMQAAGQRDPDGKPLEGQVTCLLELYVGKGLLPGLKDFAKERLLAMTAQTEKGVNWETFKEAIDKKIPVILEKDGQEYVAVGYYAKDGYRAAIIYDPSQAVHLVRTGAELSPERPKEGMDEATRKAIEWQMRQKHYIVKPLTLSSDALPAGIAILPWRDNDKGLSGTYIYGWQADLTALLPEIVKAVPGITVPSSKHQLDTPGKPRKQEP